MKSTDDQIAEAKARLEKLEKQKQDELAQQELFNQTNWEEKVHLNVQVTRQQKQNLFVKAGQLGYGTHTSSIQHMIRDLANGKLDVLRADRPKPRFY